MLRKQFSLMFFQPPLRRLALGVGRNVTVLIRAVGEPQLHADEIGALSVGLFPLRREVRAWPPVVIRPAFLQPVGIGPPQQIVVRIRDDLLEKPLFPAIAHFLRRAPPPFSIKNLCAHPELPARGWRRAVMICWT